MLKVVKLMIEHKVVLRNDSVQDWYNVLSKHEEIRVLMADLVDQLNQ